MTPGTQNAHTQLVNEILVAASALPATIVWKHNTGVGITRAGSILIAGLKGSGDIIGASGGRPIAIDAKTGTGRQKQNQQDFQAAWERAGGIYILARSVSDVLAVLT
jgi:hypothetical protein